MICPISENDEILSPAVGTFDRPPLADDTHCIGVIRRLGEIIPLCIENTEDYLITIKPRTWLMAGDVIGTIKNPKNLLKKQSDTDKIADTSKNSDCRAEHTISAPSDGFVIFTAPDGHPFVSANQIVQPGTVVAVLELMKIRMDIQYDGTAPATFVRYCGSSNRAVRNGEVIAIVQM